MELNSVIFDMDGLLIDSEPLWKKAADPVLAKWNVSLSVADYEKSTGLGTRAFLQYWLRHLELRTDQLASAEEEIVVGVVDLVAQQGQPMPGVMEIFDFFQARNFKMGIATSSPHPLIEVVIKKLGIQSLISAISSGTGLPLGKPHPQVYLNCAAALGQHAMECVCFEDSFHGMIAAKAARMKCVVVPAIHQQSELRWQAADVQLRSLREFNETILMRISEK